MSVFLAYCSYCSLLLGKKIGYHDVTRYKVDLLFFFPRTTWPFMLEVCQLFIFLLLLSLDNTSYFFHVWLHVMLFPPMILFFHSLLLTRHKNASGDVIKKRNLRILLDCLVVQNVLPANCYKMLTLETPSMKVKYIFSFKKKQNFTIQVIRDFV